MKRNRISNKKKNYSSIIFNFIIVSLLWVFFRANTFTDALDIFLSLLSGYDFSFYNTGYLNFGLNQFDWIIILLGTFFILFIDYSAKKKMNLNIEKVLQLHWFIQILLFQILLFIIILFGVYGGEYNNSSFIYRGF